MHLLPGTSDGIEDSELDTSLSAIVLLLASAIGFLLAIGQPPL